MTETGAASAWSDAVLAAALLALDPHGLGGAVVSGFAGPVRDRWLREFERLCVHAGPAGGPRPGARFLPHMDDAALLGGLDLAATLADGVPRVRRGLLADCNHGCLLVPMAERLSGLQAAAIAAALDEGECNLQRDGLSRQWPARLGVVLLNESVDADDACPGSLRERCAFHLDLTAIGLRDLSASAYGPDAVRRARARLSRVAVPEALPQALCGSAVEAGIDSLRAPILALRVARAAAALLGESAVGTAQAKLAVRLVFGPRAIAVTPRDLDQPEAPAPDSAQDQAPHDTPPEPPAPRAEAEPNAEVNDANVNDANVNDADELTEILVEAVFGAPRLSLGAATRLPVGLRRQGPAGRTGPVRSSGLRGRPQGARRGVPGSATRLDLLATLRAAAPWQTLRVRDDAGDDRDRRAVAVRRDDLHVRRFKQRAATLTIFVVDASGSAALQRLGEAKGAVELLLADCYVRRDSVALIAFRGQGADLLLPPTRSLVRARRCLAHLKGGGATPLTAGLDAAADLAALSLRRGLVPTLVVLTDGRGNLTRAGVADRRAAEQESLAVARRLQALQVATLLVDTSPRGQAFARQLAGAADALYVPLPHADARRLSNTVRGLSGARTGHAA
ncbi:MAG: magnesium chelatase subunit D [Pseudomonadales bacterium]